MIRKINKVLTELEKLDKVFFKKLISLSDFQLNILFQLKNKKNKTIEIATCVNYEGFKQSRTQRYRDISNLIKKGFCKKQQQRLVLM